MHIIIFFHEDPSSSIYIILVTNRQAGRWVGRRAGRQTGRQAGRQAGMKIIPPCRR